MHHFFDCSDKHANVTFLEEQLLEIFYNEELKMFRSQCR